MRVWSLNTRRSIFFQGKTTQRLEERLAAHTSGVKATALYDRSEAGGIGNRGADEPHGPVLERPNLRRIEREQRHVAMALVLLNALLTAISEVIEGVLESHPGAPASGLDAVREADRWARARATQLLNRT